MLFEDNEAQQQSVGIFSACFGWIKDVGYSIGTMLQSTWKQIYPSTEEQILRRLFDEFIDLESGFNIRGSYAQMSEQELEGLFSYEQIFQQLIDVVDPQQHLRKIFRQKVIELQQVTIANIVISRQAVSPRLVQPLMIDAPSIFVPSQQPLPHFIQCVAESDELPRLGDSDSDQIAEDYERAKQFTLDGMPDEILMMIISFLGKESYLQLPYINRRFKQLTPNLNYLQMYIKNTIGINLIPSPDVKINLAVYYRELIVMDALIQQKLHQIKNKEFTPYDAKAMDEKIAKQELTTDDRSELRQHRFFKHMHDFIELDSAETKGWSAFYKAIMYSLRLGVGPEHPLLKCLKWTTTKQIEVTTIDLIHACVSQYINSDVNVDANADINVDVNADINVDVNADINVNANVYVDAEVDPLDAKFDVNIDKNLFLSRMLKPLTLLVAVRIPIGPRVIVDLEEPYLNAKKAGCLEELRPHVEWVMTQVHPETGIRLRVFTPFDATYKSSYTDLYETTKYFIKTLYPEIFDRVYPNRPRNII